MNDFSKLTTSVVTTCRSRMVTECSLDVALNVYSIRVIYPAKSSAQVGVRVDSVLTRNGCIKCYILMFKEIILQQLDTFRTEIQGSLRKLCAFN